MLLLFAACSGETAQQAHSHPARTVSASASLASQDRDFLERAAQGNNAEVATGRLVDGRALRAEVVALGRMIAADHVASQQQLAAIAAKKHIPLPSGLGEQQASYDRLVDLRRDDFDRAFIRTMIDDHQQAIELFRGEVAGGVDPELKAYAAASLPKLEAHYQQVKALSSVAASPPR
ncbi:MAG TPA: DUF4142 domain-containing protein [Thermoanaerobaculia bacterium]|jgi:putative membrane protein